MMRDGLTQRMPARRGERFRKAVQGGILKVMSKMGISTLESYKGAQLFQTIGLDFDFVDEFFTGTVAHIPKASASTQIEARDRSSTHALAFSENTTGSLELEQGGDLYWRRDGELHQWNPMDRRQIPARGAHRRLRGCTSSSRAGLNDQQERLQTMRGLLDFEH